jgi:hypothetical protein
MRITFRGWRREKLIHKKSVLPVSLEMTEDGAPRYMAGTSGDPINWSLPTTAFGKLQTLGLNGDFLVTFEFTPEELRNWLKAYVSSEPEAAARLLAEMQGEVVIELAQKAKNEAIWSCSQIIARKT